MKHTKDASQRQGREGTTARKRSTTKRAAPKIPADVLRGVAAALDKKAEHVALLDLRRSTAFTDFFVILSGNNVRQVQAIADAIEAALKERGQRPALVEGYQRGEWVLLDYFDVIFHVFTPATREFYSLERLWADAVHVELPATLDA